MATQRLGRPACGKSLPVRAGAPLGHWIEEKVKPGAVRLTLRDASGYGVGGQDICAGTGVLPSNTRGAGFTMEQFEEELLDYLGGRGSSGSGKGAPEDSADGWQIADSISGEQKGGPERSSGWKTSSGVGCWRSA
ncbi:hypothetical protein NDU88_005057 [Pleurodeles waltl]|uniref:Uncharacterized protein n=1 Tax=Pleurodeles waltl TaxID=8319 RepID=A0AAV7WYF6_PLEWA|nr:hypothetical protein NDU88_005057 [Pleurodeles waltl]